MAIDLNAIIDEAKRDTIPLKIGRKTHELPGELPLDVFAPFLDPELDLTEIIGEIAGRIKEAGDDESMTSVVIDALFENPAIPLKVIQAAGEAAEKLLGEEAYAAFWATRPGLSVVRGFWKELAAHYSVSFSDFFESADSSGTTGDASKPTSSAGTSSTPEVSGAAPETPAAS